MSNDSINPGGEKKGQPVRPGPAIEAEIHRLTDALLENTLTEPQRRRLEEIVAAHPGAAEVYLEIMYEWGSLPNYVTPSLIDLSAVEKQAQPATQMSETMILPAVHLGDVDEDEAPLVFHPRPCRPRGSRRCPTAG